MLSLDTISAAKLYQKPFSWTWIEDFWPGDFAKDVARSYPALHFNESVGNEGHYKLSDRLVVEASEIQNISDFTMVWKNIIKQFLEPGYRQTIEKLFNMDLADTEIKIRLCKYKGDCWMKPHTDRVDRVVTQIIYLSEEWMPEWGGNLLLLNSPEEADVEKCLPPTFNTTVLFARSDNSWHAVQGIEKTVSEERKTILLQFIKA